MTNSINIFNVTYLIPKILEYNLRILWKNLAKTKPFKNLVYLGQNSIFPILE